MDEKQKQFIDIRKKSIRDKNSREYQDLSSEDPFSIGWIRNEYQYVKRALPKKSYIIPYNEVVLRRLDGTLSSKGMHDKVKKALEDTTAQIIAGITRHFSRNVVKLPPKNKHQSSRRLSEDNFDEFSSLVVERRYFTEPRVCSMCKKASYYDTYMNNLAELDMGVRLARENAKKKSVSDRVARYLRQEGIRVTDHITYEVETYFNMEVISGLLKYNRNLMLFNMLTSREEVNNKLKKHLLEKIPDSYVDLYPDARLMHRHFYIHHGPTNSGKTYQSVQRLMTAQKGIYAGPLRLLAYEVFDRLNRADVLCSLLTGEESIPIPGATVQASTVEMVNVYDEYDIAVIDEAQLVGDKFRGGAWTRAILGVRAAEVHLCCANEAVPILTAMIEDCHDTYELIAHERNTPLLVDERPFTFPDSIEPHDALIVFSRKDVHAVAAELQRLGRKCSVIYGNLPYDVRHKEAARFMTGETDVLVSTDAIGLGLNLPIKRVVFLRLDKFDGYEVRELTGAEVKQIAGRAGRFGIFDRGYVTSEDSPEFIREKLFETPEPLSFATIQFPETIIDIDAPMHEILRRWRDVTVNEGYSKANIDREIALCEMLGQFADDKYFLYKTITIPFDERNKTILDIWYEMARAEYNNVTLIPQVLYGKYVEGNKRLDYLERAYHICDLLYNFAVKFKHEEYIDEIMLTKQLLSERIIKLLSANKLAPKKCNRCGRQIPWNYRYGLCSHCR